MGKLYLNSQKEELDIEVRDELNTELKKHLRTHPDSVLVVTGPAGDLSCAWHLFDKLQAPANHC
jgi:hypothetical protein